MPTRVNAPDALTDDKLQPAIEHLRQGTREQYESGWTKIVAAHEVAFEHNLGEIPWTVNVIRAISADGKFPQVAPATDYTVAYTDIDGKSGSGETHCTVTNNSTDTDYWFKVRAM